MQENVNSSRSRSRNMQKESCKPTTAAKCSTYELRSDTKAKRNTLATKAHQIDSHQRVAKLKAGLLMEKKSKLKDFRKLVDMLGAALRQPECDYHYIDKTERLM